MTALIGNPFIFRAFLSPNSGGAKAPDFGMKALADHVVETSSSMSPQHISNIAWAFATLELKFPAALEAPDSNKPLQPIAVAEVSG
eukprot:137478-Amphidinium_carterae.1